MYNIYVSKQKIILIIFLVILIIGFLLFYFFIQRQNSNIDKNKNTDFLDKELTPLKTREEITEELEAYREPTRETIIPLNTPTDQTIKNDAEIKNEIDAFEIKEENNNQNLTDQEILQLLKNPSLNN